MLCKALVTFHSALWLRTIDASESVLEFSHGGTVSTSSLSYARLQCLPSFSIVAKAGPSWMSMSCRLFLVAVLPINMQSVSPPHQHAKCISSPSTCKVYLLPMNMQSVSPPHQHAKCISSPSTCKVYLLPINMQSVSPPHQHAKCISGAHTRRVVRAATLEIRTADRTLYLTQSQC